MRFIVKWFIVAKITRIPETKSRDSWFFPKKGQNLFYDQFLGHDASILFNNIDQIDTLIPVGGIDIDDLAALLLADFLSNEVIDLHFSQIGTFHGELSRGRVGVEFGFGGEFGDAKQFVIDIKVSLLAI